MEGALSAAYRKHQELQPKACHCQKSQDVAETFRLVDGRARREKYGRLIEHDSSALPRSTVQRWQAIIVQQSL